MKQSGVDEEKVEDEVVEEAREEETPAPESEEPKEQPEPKTFDELKVVIIAKNDNLMIGVQSPDCDPVYTTLKGTLAAALKKVPKLVDEAKQQWTENPRYPKADLPAPPPSTVSSAPAREEKKQPSFF